MNLNDIEKKCFILALFIRDDAQRFLLGSGAYEFKDSQLHFSANTMKNDVVEVQGNDGYMLAGQVRRPTTQVFDGYIGDASVTKAEIEGYRRDFLAFFSKNHYFTVVYVFADGSAIQRRRGFIVDAPEVRELWQMYPEYHIGMNFEDVNYYRYGENAQGEEAYGKSATVELSTSLFGGLEWEDGVLSPSSIEREGNPISFGGTDSGKNIQTFQIKGNLTEIPDTRYTQVEWLGGTGTQYLDTGVKTNSTMKVVANLTIGSTTGNQIFGEGSPGSYVNLGLMNHSGYYRGRCRRNAGANMDIASTVPCGDGVFHNFEVSQAGGFWIDGTKIGNFQSYTYTSNTSLFLYAMNGNGNPVGGTICNGKIKRLKIYDNGSLVRDFVPAIRNSDNVAGMYDLVEDTFYTNIGTGTFTTGNEIPQPTPEFPETIQTVTGEQTIVVSDGANQSQSLTVDLGSIELAKVDTARDYIYKDVNDWYIHREVQKISSYAGESITTPYISSTGQLSTGATVYYALATATDTQITDSVLINELEAILDADTYDGQTVIEATSDDVLPTLRAKVAVMVMEGGVVWDSYGAVWEEGGGGKTTVQVDSIENVYPVWTVTGPAYNPVLENLTTGTAISYSGNVTATQTLVIDMMNQTAKLNGTSVISNVSGEWLEFVPGNNTVSYTASNGDAPDSTIEWQEVVG